MSGESPDYLYDIVVHGRLRENVYRVAIFGKLADEWLAEWKERFLNIDDIENHCAHIALSVHEGFGRSFLEGYGKLTWRDIHWQRLQILDSDGGEIACAMVRLIDASVWSEKTDLLEILEAKWYGFDRISE